MKEKIGEMLEFFESDQRNSEWARKCDFKQRVKEFLNEAEEVKEALEKNDIKTHNNKIVGAPKDKNFLCGLKDELGDVLFDLIYAIYMGEKEGILTSDEIVDNVLKKIKRRKPWAEEGRKVSLEEELRIWKEVKEKEKTGFYDDNN